ncbi:MAG: ABC transporter permease [Spirochaetales bacterium]|nr:ABC transporter permease [Spirochaetales bacterium]
MRRIGYIIQKEFRQLSRDIRMILIIFISPVLQLLLLGYAANLDVKDVPLFVCDADNSVQSRSLVQSMVNARYFDIKDTVSDSRKIEKAMLGGRAAIALVIPKGFGKDIVSGKGSTVQLIADGSDSNTATIGLNYASMIITAFSADIYIGRAGRSGVSLSPRVIAEERIWYNPNLESRNFMVPGILAMLLMMMTMLLTSMAIVREREIGTMEQLSVTPIKPFELIIGKLTPFIIIAFVDVFLVVLVSTFIFRIPIKGNVGLLFGLSGIFLLSTLGFGLFISTVSKNQQQAMFSSTFFIMIPMIILSGFVFPIENMPMIIQYLTALMPLRYYFIIIRGLFLKGADMSTLWDETLILFLLGTAILVLSALRVRKRVT